MPSLAKNRPKKSKPATVNTKVLPPAKEIKVEPQANEVEPQKSQLGFWILLAVGVVMLVVAAFVAFSHNMTGWELKVFKFINQAGLSDQFTSIAKSLSNAVWGIIGLIVVCFLFVPKYRYTAWQYGVAAGSAYVASFIVEHIVDRARPVLLYDGTIMRAAQDGPGFPSSHVAVLTAILLTG